MSTPTDTPFSNTTLVRPQQSLTHRPAPQRWNPRDHDDHCLAGRKLRRFGRATQTLVPQLRVGVGIAVPLQLVEKQIAHDVIAVPTVSGAAANVRAVGTLATQQAVMLEVVRGFEEGESGNCLQQEPGRDLPTEDTDQRREEDNTHRPSVENIVLEAPGSFAFPLESSALDAPCRTQPAEHTSWQEPPEALTEP